MIRNSEFVVRTQLLYSKTPDKKKTKNGFAEKEEKNLKQKMQKPNKVKKK